MKLKVVCKKHKVRIEAETIDTLKALIMDEFSLTADKLSQQRLLVRGKRDLRFNRDPVTGCVDLLELADGSILDDNDTLVKDGDTLVLGWKGPCTVRLLRVVCKKHKVWIEAETIDTLKALIMDEFSLTADQLSQERLLVRDNRDLGLNRDPVTGCVDLLQLADGSILDDTLVEDGDTLILGWKGPFTVRLVTDFILNEGHSFEVDDSFPIRDLKRKIERLTGEDVTTENLPKVLFDGDDDKPIRFFGFYRFQNPTLVVLKIHRSKDNMPVSIYPIMSLVMLDANGNKCFQHLRGDYFEIEPEELEKSIENGKRKIQSKENIENQKKKKKNKGIESDEEEVICPYEFGKESQPFNKEKHEESSTSFFVSTITTT